MPADPYSLGIGVDVDRRTTRDALGRFSRVVEDEAQQAGTALEDALAIDEIVGDREITWLDRMEVRLKSLKRPAMEALGAVQGLVSGFRDGLDFMKPAEELENATQRIAVTMGGGKAQAAGLRDEIFNLGTTTRFSVSEMTQLAQGLGNTGMTLGSFSDETQTAMIQMNQIFGRSGEEIATTAVTMRSFGSDIDTLLGDATTFTKGFKIPGMFEELPGVVSKARDSVLRFGERVVGSGANVVKATMNMAGTFAKAFGTTIADAVGRAQDAMGKFASAALKDRRVFLGLEDDFSGLTMALLQTGAGLDTSMRLVREGAQGSLDAVSELAAIRDRMPDGIMKDRFTEQLREELPADIMDLVEHTDKLREAMSAQKEAEKFADSVGGQGVAAFNELGSSVLDTTIEMRKMFNNVLELTRAIIGNVAITLGLPDILHNARDAFAGFAKKIHDFTKSDEFQETIERWKPTVVAVGSAVLKVATVIGSLGAAVVGIGGAMATANAGMSGFATLLRVIPGVGSVFDSFGGIVKKVVGKAGPIGLFIAAFEGIKTAVYDMGAVLGDPNATGMEKMEALVRGLLKGVGSAFDTILLGIPGMIADKFFPDMESKFDAGVSGVFDKVAATFGEFAPKVIPFLKTQMAALGTWLYTEAPGLATSFGEALGASIGGLISLVGTGVQALASGVVSLFTSNVNDGLPGFGESLLTGLAGIGSSILGFFGGVGRGLLGAFGVSLDAVQTRFAIAWEVISFNAAEIFRDMGEAYMANFSDPLSMALLEVGNTFSEFGTNVYAFVATAFAKISGAIDSTWATVRVGALYMASGLVDVFKDMSMKVIDSFAGIVDALPDSIPGVEEMRAGLQGARDTLNSVSSGFDQMAQAAQVQAQVAAAVSQGRIAQIEGERQASLSAIEQTRLAEVEHFEERQRQRDEDEAAREQAHDQRVGQLMAQMNAQRESFDQQQAAATAVRRGAEGTLAPTTTAPAMDGLVVGAVTTDEQRERLAAASGPPTPMPQVPPGDVASRAGGGAARGGSEQQQQVLTPDAVARMFRDFSADLRLQQLRVQITGDGDVTRALARAANVRNMSTNGGGS